MHCPRICNFAPRSPIPCSITLLLLVVTTGWMLACSGPRPAPTNNAFDSSAVQPSEGPVVSEPEPEPEPEPDPEPSPSPLRPAALAPSSGQEIDSGPALSPIPTKPRVLPATGAPPLFLREVVLEPEKPYSVPEADLTLRVETIRYINSPCPPGARCVWSGVMKEADLLVVPQGQDPAAGETILIREGQRHREGNLIIDPVKVEPDRVTFSLGITDSSSD